MKKFMITAVLVALCAVMGIGFSRSKSSQPAVDSVPGREVKGEKYKRGPRCSCCNQKLPKNRWWRGRSQNRKARDDT